MTHPRLPSRVADPSEGPWIVLAAALVWSLVAAWFFQDGSFFDALTYSSIARNTAAAGDAFWRPRAEFHLVGVTFEQPPLAPWLQSLLFRALGDHLWVDAIFAALGTAASLALLIALWRRMVPAGGPGLAWLPVVLFVLPPVVHRTCRDTMLETTMGPLAAASVLLYWLGRERTRVAAVAVAGLLVLLAFLAKGPPALFPFAAPALWWFSSRGRVRGRDMAHDTALMVGSFGFALGALLFVSDDARTFLLQYLRQQVLASVSGEREVTGSRGGFLIRLLLEAGPILALTLAAYLGRRTALAAAWRDGETRHRVLFMLLVGLSASLPLTVSPKLRPFYLAPAFPYFALSAALLLRTVATDIVAAVAARRTATRALRFAALAAVLAAAGLTWAVSGTPRDPEPLAIVHALAPRLRPQQRVEFLQEDWRLRAYLQRYLRLSVDLEPLPRGHWVVAAPGAALPGYDLVLTTAHRSLLERSPGTPVLR
jgi:4-amino-4-deoxy-L-arabinose transferase-like glycosyltransferase